MKKIILVLPEEYLGAVVSILPSRDWDARIIGESFSPIFEDWGFKVEFLVPKDVEEEDIWEALDWGEAELPSLSIREFLVKELLKDYEKRR